MSQPYSMVLVSFLLSFTLLVGITLYRLVLKRKVNLLVLLVLVSLLPLWSIFRNGTYESGDLTLHTVYLQSFYENLKDGIFIPQWAGGLCAGKGCPLFMFEYVMPFYVGSLFHILGFSYLNSTKLFLASSYILSGITMYAFLREHVDKRAAFVGSLLYLFAPIRFIEMHFRVSVGTDASFIFIPLAFLFAKKSMEGKMNYVVLGAINFLFLILSHSSIALVIIPSSLIYAIVSSKKNKMVIFLIIFYILGLGLSAYYVLPAITEIKYTWYSQFINLWTDFKPLSDYIFSPSRFGLLFQGNQGELRLIVGYLQLIVLFLSLIQIAKKRLGKKEKSLALYLISLFGVSFILMLSFTKPIWDNFFLLRSFILPWRMLVPISFFLAFLGSIVVKKWGISFAVIFSGFIIFSTILNWGNRKMVPFSKNAYFTQSNLYTEYFDSTNPTYKARYQAYNSQEKQDELALKQPKNHLDLISGNAKVAELRRTQVKHEYLIKVNEKSEFSENTFYFPGWRVYVNGRDYPINYVDERSFGELVFSLPKGLYLIEAEFQDTQTRKFGKIISLSTAFIILLYAIYFTFHRFKYVVTSSFHV